MIFHHYRVIATTGLMPKAKKLSKSLYNDSAGHDNIVAEPTVLGIDGVSHSGMTITTLIQTEAGQPWAVGREFRLRVRRALAENGIEIGTPRTYSLEAPSAPIHDRHDRFLETEDGWTSPEHRWAQGLYLLIFIYRVICITLSNSIYFLYNSGDTKIVFHKKNSIHSNTPIYCSLK